MSKHHKKALSFAVLVSLGLVMALLLPLTASAKMNKLVGSQSPQLIAQSSQPSQKGLYVATDGKNEGKGTIDQPFKSIQKALDAATPGTTVYIRGGNYHERVNISKSGSATDGYITVQNYPQETVTIDAVGINDGSSAMFNIYGQQYVKIIGLNLTQNVVDDASAFNINQGSHHIEIRNNKISHMDRKSASSMPIFVSSSLSSNVPTHDIIINGNEIFNCDAGSAQAVTVMGNVEKVEFSNNSVHDLPTIAVDFLGNYQSVSNPALDHARKSVIRDNTLYNVSSICIYIDGGEDNVVERNTLSNCTKGIDVVSERKGGAARNIVRDNLIVDTKQVGLAFGNWANQGDDIVDCQIYNNTVVNSELVLAANRSSGCIVKNNLLVGGQKSTLLNQQNAKNLLTDYNLWYGQNGHGFSLQGKWYNSLADYQNASGQDKNSHFGDPLFSNSNSSAPNFRFTSGSPAFNAGDPSFVPAQDQRDLDNQSRVESSRIDAGAYEL